MIFFCKYKTKEEERVMIMVNKGLGGLGGSISSIAFLLNQTYQT